MLGTEMSQLLMFLNCHCKILHKPETRIIIGKQIIALSMLDLSARLHNTRPFTEMNLTHAYRQRTRTVWQTYKQTNRGRNITSLKTVTII